MIESGRRHQNTELRSIDVSRRLLVHPHEIADRAGVRVAITQCLQNIELAVPRIAVLPEIGIE